MKRLAEKDIKFESVGYWVADTGDSYTVFKIGCTHSTSDSAYSRDADGLSIAIARCKYLSNAEYVIAKARGTK